MNSGVNKNGVRWIKDGNKYECFYQLTSDVELHKTSENTNQKEINDLTFIQLLNEQVNVQKNNTK